MSMAGKDPGPLPPPPTKQLRFACVLCGLTKGKADRLGLNLTFHSFPQAKSIRDEWEAFCGRKGELLCSAHFTKDCFYRPAAPTPDGQNAVRLKGLKLWRGAVPSIREVHHEGVDQEELPVMPKLQPKPVDPVEPGRRRLRNCFLCRQKTMHHVPISDDIQPTTDGTAKSDNSLDLGSYRGTIILKYFQPELKFEPKNMLGECVCLRCWLKVDEFHQLLNDIKEAHLQKHIPVSRKDIEHEPLESLPNVKIEVLAETNEEMPDCPTEKDIKTEPLVEEDIKTEPAEDNQPNVEVVIDVQNAEYESYEILELTDIEKEPPPAPAAAGPPEKKPRLLKCTIRCRWCARCFEEFGQMQAHCAEVHQTVGYVTCCGTKFTAEAALGEHMEEVHVAARRKRSRDVRSLCGVE